MLLQQSKPGTHHFACRRKTPRSNLALNEAYEMIAENDGSVLGDDGNSLSSTYQ